MTPDRRPRYLCTRCNVVVKYLPGFSASTRLPTGWADDGDGLLCLGCRRNLAAAGATPGADRNRALAEFELSRDADRKDGEIARALGVPTRVISAARKARDG